MFVLKFGGTSVADRAAITEAVAAQIKAQPAEIAARVSQMMDNVKALEKELARLKAKLEQSERAMQEYKEATKSVSLEDRQNVVVEKLKELNQRVTEAKSIRITHETAYNQAKNIGNNHRRRRQHVNVNALHLSLYALRTHCESHHDNGLCFVPVWSNAARLYPST